MQTSIQIVRNDQLYDIPFTLQDGNGVKLDLTGAALAFKAQNLESAVNFTRNMTITDAPNGLAKYTVQAGDFATAGSYQCEIQITFASGQIQTYPNIFVNVLADIPL